MTRALCRHCGKKPAWRPRGLCWVCWHDESIRAQYPLHRFACNKNGAAGGDFNGGYALPHSATTASPGSPAKIRVLQRRAGRRVSLFHPDDALGHPPPSVHAGRVSWSKERQA